MQYNPDDILDKIYYIIILMAVAVTAMIISVIILQ